MHTKCSKAALTQALEGAKRNSWKVHDCMPFKKNYSIILFHFFFDLQDNSDGEVQEFLVGAQTEDQRKLLENYMSDKPLYVEGPFFIWVRRLQRHFFTLRTDAELDEENGEGKVTILKCLFTDCHKFLLIWFLWLTQACKSPFRFSRKK